jgi:hypothetical protein
MPAGLSSSTRHLPHPHRHSAAVCIIHRHTIHASARRTTQLATSVTDVADDTLGLTMHHSKRIAAQPPSSAKLADCARDTKMKKLGLSIANADSKAEKKMQLLKKLGGNVPKHADEVLSQLLTGPEKVA